MSGECKFISYSQELDIEADFDQIDDRLAELDDRMAASAAYKRKESLQKICIAFLRKSGYESLTACTPDDIRRFLAWKDCNGKTTIHDIQCPFLGQKVLFIVIAQSV